MTQWFRKRLVLLIFCGTATFTCFATIAEASPPSPLDFANGLFHRGFYEDALDEYNNYLEATPDGADAPTAWLRLGRCAVALNRFETAIDAFQRVESAIATGELWMDARISRGEALFFLGRHDDAALLLEATLQESVSPEMRARALFYLGRARMEANDIPSAIAALTALTSEMPDTQLAPYALYQLGYAQLKAENVEAAATAFSGVANTPEAEPELRMESRFRAAELYDKLGWTAPALGAYEQLRSEFPDSEYARRADYGYAWALYHSARYDEAIALADAFTRDHQDSPLLPGIVYLKGNARHQQGQYEDALAAFANLRTTWPESLFATRALYKIAWARYLAGNVSGAREAAMAYLDLPDNTEFSGEAVYLLGMASVALGDYEDALKEFRLAAEKYGESEFGPDALFKSAECYAQLGMRNQSALAFEAFVERYPEHLLAAQATLRSGDARFSEKEYERALGHYERLLTIDLEPELQETALYRLAATQHNLGRGDESAAAFRKIIERFPDSVHAQEAWLRIGDAALESDGDPLKAVEAYSAALKHAPNPAATARALQGLATARYRQKDHAEAAAHVLRLVVEYPDTPLTTDAYMWSGTWMMDAGQHGNAAQVFAAMLEAHPEHEQRANVLMTLGRCYEEDGQTKEAMRVYAAAIEEGGEPARNAELRFRLARLHETANDLSKAEALYEEAANLDGGEVSARARFQLASLLEARGDCDGAVRNFMRLAILFVHESLSPEALWRAGNCCQQQGNLAQAKSIFEELLKDYPDSPFAEHAASALASMDTGAETAG